MIRRFNPSLDGPEIAVDRARLIELRERDIDARYGDAEATDARPDCQVQIRTIDGAWVPASRIAPAVIAKGLR